MSQIMAFVRSVMPPRVNGTIRLVDNSIVAIAGPQRDFAVVDFFALVAPTDPLGFGVRLSGTSFSIKNSLEHFGQVRRDIKSLSMIVPMTRGFDSAGRRCTVPVRQFDFSTRPGHFGDVKIPAGSFPAVAVGRSPPQAQSSAQSGAWWSNHIHRRFHKGGIPDSPDHDTAVGP